MQVQPLTGAFGAEILDAARLRDIGACFGSLDRHAFMKSVPDVPDLPTEEGQALLAELVAHSTRDEFVSRLKWQPGTLAFWDNRSTQHYALNDYQGQRRAMLLVVIEGDRPV
jgi:alpha-ketoglutarate-dependent taurine dioxygenase